MRNTTQSTSVFILVAGLLGACAARDSSAETNDCEDGVPELAAVELRLTGDAEAEGLATEQDSLEAEAMLVTELGAAQEAAEADVASELVGARAAVRSLNQALRAFLQPIVATVRNSEPSLTRGNVRMWEQVERGLTEYRFIMRRNAPEHYGWLLQASIADESDFVPVAAGELHVATEARRGRGKAVFDLNALGGVDPLVAARGTILVGFTHGEVGTTVGYALKGFTRDADLSEPIDALLQQVRLSGPRYRLRLAYRGSVLGTPSDAEEVVFARHRHAVGSGGRSDMIVVAGDVPAGEAWVISQCWSAALVEEYRAARSCPLDGLEGDGCSVVSTIGEPSACAPGLEAAELPPSDPNAPMSDTEDPNDDVVIPESFADVDAPQQ